jgi:hypothetical protein
MAPLLSCYNVDVRASLLASCDTSKKSSLN